MPRERGIFFDLLLPPKIPIRDMGHRAIRRDLRAAGWTRQTGRVLASLHYPIALASSTASRLMTSSSAPSQLMSLLPPGSASAGTASVTAVTLADFLDENGIENVDLLKMDIEGSEFEVLLTAEIETLRRIRRVELEYHERQGPESKKDLVARFEKAGFRKTFDTGQDDVYGLARFERQ